MAKAHSTVLYRRYDGESLEAGILHVMQRMTQLLLLILCVPLLPTTCDTHEIVEKCAKKI